MDEFCGVGGGGDDFSVEELLDFSNDNSKMEEILEQQREIEAAKTKIEASTVEEREGGVFDSLGGALCSGGEFRMGFTIHGGLVSDYSLTGKLPDKAAEQRPWFNNSVQTKARTKRARAGFRVWPVLSPSLDHSASPLSSTSSMTSFSVSPPASSLESAAPAKKKRKLRYKSGRLLPEYRPACSPTFSSEVHLNNYRKVLEMRRKKEMEMPTTGLPPPIRSF